MFASYKNMSLTKAVNPISVINNLVARCLRRARLTEVVSGAGMLWGRCALLDRVLEAAENVMRRSIASAPTGGTAGDRMGIVSGHDANDLKLGLLERQAPSQQNIYLDRLS